MKSWSIKLRVTAWYAFSLLLICIAAAALIIYTGHNIIREDVKEKLVTLVRDNTREVRYVPDIASESLNNGDLHIAYEGGFIEIDDHFCDYSDEIYTSLYGADNELIYGENPILLDCPKAPDVSIMTTVTAYNGQKYYLYDQYVEIEGTTGLWLRGVVPVNAGTAVIDKVISFATWLFPALWLLSLLTGWLLAHFSFKPVNKICMTANAIREGDDLSKRIALGDGKDELHRLANAFDEMFDSLEKSFEDEKRFTSDASHELRTPTAVIMAQCEYALEKPRSAAEYVDSLEVIKRQDTRMTRLIAQMLNYTRLEQRKEFADKEMTDLSELVNIVCDEHEGSQQNGITMTRSIGSNINAEVDRDLFVRLVDNLISNAYKYGKENGTVNISLSESDGRVMLNVEDDGIGIAAEHLDKIFDRFYRVDTSRTGDKGTGLGLSMVKRIAKLHGGDISVESTPGKGSCFTFTMPVKKAAG
jgi:signal transduction histidine kinase